MKFFFIILLVTLASCQSTTSSQSCDEISMQKFRGVPMANKRFEEKCQGASVTYTAQLCQTALGHLIQTQSLEQVQEKFGDPVKGCFTQADLDRFNKLP